MTQKEKIKSLKGTITFLYEKEGRSKSYIAKLLEVDRKTLIKYINKWELVQGNTKHLTPSKEKFLKKNKNKIISLYNNDFNTSEIERELKVNKGFLRSLISYDKDIENAKNHYEKNHVSKTDSKKKQKQEDFSFKDLKGEKWKPILGHDNYYISNKGRVKKYLKKYDCYQLLVLTKNCRSGRLYVKIDDSNLSVARLVGFAFVKGYSSINNTIDHKDTDILNNDATNLQWVSQSKNNKLSYERGKKPHKAYSKNKFEKIVLDDKYEFKTIRALAKFLNVSESQANRYISGETKINHKIKLI